MTYTIWMCCGEFEQEDTREEALGMAAAYMNGDGHSVIAVEGPNGEDLTAEAEELDRQRSKQWVEQSKQARRKLLGYVEVKGPTGEWWGREYVYNPDVRDRELAEQQAIYGEGRVRWVDQQ